MDNQPPSFGGPTPPGVPAPTEAHRRSPVMVWGVVAAVVSAAAGVASAVAAFTGGSPHPSAAPATSVVAPAPAPDPATVATATAKPVPTPAAEVSVRWTGKVVLGMEGIDLAQVPPTKGDSLPFFQPAAQRSGSSGMAVRGPSALWTEAGEPTAQGCRDLLLTQQHKEVDVVAGDRVCVADGSSPIGLLKVTKTHYSQGSYGELDVEVTIWNLRLKG